MRAAGGRRVGRATGDGVPGGDGAGRVPARRQAICMCPIHCIAAGRLNAWSNPRARLIPVVCVALRASPPDERATPWKVHDAALSNAAISRMSRAPRGGGRSRRPLAVQRRRRTCRRAADAGPGDPDAPGDRRQGRLLEHRRQAARRHRPAAPHRDADAPEEAPRGEGRRTPEGHDQPPGRRPDHPARRRRHTSPSVSARTTASGPAWPGSPCASSSRNSARASRTSSAPAGRNDSRTPSSPAGSTCRSPPGPAPAPTACRTEESQEGGEPGARATRPAPRATPDRRQPPRPPAIGWGFPHVRRGLPRALSGQVLCIAWKQVMRASRRGQRPSCARVCWSTACSL